MDADSLACAAFVFFGFGFFLLMVSIVLRDDDVKYRRWKDDAREFGYDNMRQQRPNTKINRRI